MLIIVVVISLFIYDTAHDSKSETPDKAAPAYRQKKAQDSVIAMTSSANHPNQREHPVEMQS